MSFVFELLNDELDGFGRNIEGNSDRSSRRREYRGIDPDHFALDVKGRPARVSQVHRRVDLNEIIIGTFADIASSRAL
jgi:hypothetical protein